MTLRVTFFEPKRRHNRKEPVQRTQTARCATAQFSGREAPACLHDEPLGVPFLFGEAQRECPDARQRLDTGDTVLVDHTSVPPGCPRTPSRCLELWRASRPQAISGPCGYTGPREATGVSKEFV